MTTENQNAEAPASVHDGFFDIGEGLEMLRVLEKTLSTDALDSAVIGLFSKRILEEACDRIEDALDDIKEQFPDVGKLNKWWLVGTIPEDQQEAVEEFAKDLLSGKINMFEPKDQGGQDTEKGGADDEGTL